MAEITITESDLTYGGAVSLETNVVYVPGLIGTDPKEGETIKLHTPTLFTNIEDFKAAVGKAPYEFLYKQAYPTAYFKPDYDFAIITPAGEETDPVYADMFKAGDFDPSYQYAIELINSGVPVLYEAVVDTALDTANDALVTALYTAFAADDIYTNIADRGEYQVKFLTLGGYPSFGTESDAIALKLIGCAKTRGDCVALVDHTDYSARPLATDNEKSVYAALESIGELIGGEYAAMFTPWATYSRTVTFEDSGNTVDMPASFAFLKCFIKASRSNSDWIAIAGVTRGIVPNIVALKTDTRLSNAIADSYQVMASNKISINAITNIKPYGLCIWGNRTLYKEAGTTDVKAYGFLNIRNFIGEVKKVVFSTAQRLTFEQNNSILWVNFKSLIMPTLDRAVTNYGISNYKLIRETPTKKNELKASIIIYPTYDVEQFTINITLSDTETVVS